MSINANQTCPIFKNIIERAQHEIMKERRDIFQRGILNPRRSKERESKEPHAMAVLR